MVAFTLFLFWKKNNFRGLPYTQFGWSTMFNHKLLSLECDLNIIYSFLSPFSVDICRKWKFSCVNCGMGGYCDKLFPDRKITLFAPTLPFPKKIKRRGRDKNDFAPFYLVSAIRCCPLKVVWLLVFHCHMFFFGHSFLRKFHVQPSFNLSDF